MTAARGTLRAVGPAAFGASVLFGVGQGALAPAVALSAREAGASVGEASLVVAAAGVGLLVGDIPAGALTARLGDRRAMLLATALTLLSLATCLAAGSVPVLAVGVAGTGGAFALWGLARQTYVTDAVPLALRALALATLGGSQRVGMFVGPFLGAAAMTRLGPDGGYWVHLVAAAAAGAVLLALPDPGPRERPRGAVAGGTLAVARSSLPVLRTLGAGVLLIGAVRASRQAVLPLWAEHVGLDASTTSLLFGVAGAVDMALFYPAGLVMDRLGRAWVAVPSLLVLGVAHLLLPLTGSVATVGAVAVLLGAGNGIGSGLVMVLGADAAPAAGRAEFLGVWRLCADAGSAAGPLAVAAVTALSSLAPAVLVLGVVGIAGAGVLGRGIPAHRPQLDSP